MYARALGAHFTAYTYRLTEYKTSMDNQGIHNSEQEICTAIYLINYDNQKLSVENKLYELYSL